MNLLILPILLLANTMLFGQNNFIVSSSSSFEQSGWGEAFVADGITSELANAKEWSSNANTTVSGGEIDK